MISSPILGNYKDNRKIIHIDMDSFYASVEIAEKPNLKSKPVAVAGSSETRGVVTTCNYEARKFGVRSAMPSITAKKLCPNIVFIPVHMDKYRNISKEIHRIFKCYTKVIPAEAVILRSLCILLRICIAIFDGSPLQYFE